MKMLTRFKRQPVVAASALMSVAVCLFTFATIINCLARSRPETRFPHFCWWPLFLTFAITCCFLFHGSNSTIERYRHAVSSFIATDLAAVTFAIYLLASSNWERLLALAVFVIHSIIMCFWLIYLGHTRVSARESNSHLDEEQGRAVQPPAWPYRARALFTYDANDSDSNELSFLKGDLLYVSDISGFWWHVKDTNGRQGIAPSSYLMLFSSVTQTDSS